LGVLILTGGASLRMGADKAELDWAGRRAIDRVADLAGRLGAEPVLSVGPGDYGLDRVAEDPPGGGPAAGILAGARRLSAAGRARALVLAVDAPTLTPADLAPLLDAGPPGAAYAHLHLPLLVDLASLPAEDGWGWSMARLITELGLPLLAPPAGSESRLRGANTPEERQALLDDFAAHESARKPGGG
jgi:molybdopterin-guanine dinucleotide biosynthesis protein A